MMMGWMARVWDVGRMKGQRSKAGEPSWEELLRRLTRDRHAGRQACMRLKTYEYMTIALASPCQAKLMLPQPPWSLCY
jgi:hypothetical protein